MTSRRTKQFGEDGSVRIVWLGERGAADVRGDVLSASVEPVAVVNEARLVEVSAVRQAERTVELEHDLVLEAPDPLLARFERTDQRMASSVVVDRCMLAR